jgi:hypothetical protein
MPYHKAPAHTDSINHYLCAQNMSDPEHISLPVDNIRARGCTWIVNGVYCRQPCVPFLFVCNEHKDIPDFPRHIRDTSSCRKRK